jgi:hypothetical protein
LGKSIGIGTYPTPNHCMVSGKGQLGRRKKKTRQNNIFQNNFLFNEQMRIGVGSIISYCEKSKSHCIYKNIYIVLFLQVYFLNN